MLILLIKATVKHLNNFPVLTLSGGNVGVEFCSNQAPGTFPKWSLPNPCLCETVMRQAGTLSWLKSIPIGLRYAAFPRSAWLITTQLRKQESESLKRYMFCPCMDNLTDNPHTPLNQSVLSSCLSEARLRLLPGCCLCPLVSHSPLLSPYWAFFHSVVNNGYNLNQDIAP